MATSRERAALAGYLVFASCVAAAGFWMANTGPATTPTNAPADEQSHAPGAAAPDGQTGDERTCYDGTRGTFADCWERIQADASRDAAARAATAQPTRWPTPTAWPTPTMPALTLPPAAGTEPFQRGH